VANSQVIAHVTATGERWDLLAWTYYGDASLFAPIVMANPGVAIEPVLEAGLVIVIPILQQAATVAADLPPWKRPLS